MNAWHGDPALKERIVARMRKHREDDDLIQGIYQRVAPEKALGYRGCAVGCALDPQPAYGGTHGEVRQPADGWHMEMERQLGIHANVAILVVDRFEDLEAPDHAEFAVAVLEAIPVGADLDAVEDAYYYEADADSVDERAAAALLIRLLAAAPVRGSRHDV